MSWDIIISYTLKGLLLPPGINLIIMVLAVFLFRKYARLATSLLVLSFTTLFLLSLPSIAQTLIQNIEPTSVLNSTQLRQISNDDTPRAIVVLSGGRIALAPEYGDIDTVNSATLQRIQYASWLQKRTNLPVLLSGGSVFNEATAESVLMNQVMMSNFAIAPKWIESESKNTAENALYSAQILIKNDIKEILLVTHAWHMRRAKNAFEAQGIKVLEAATAFESSHAKQTRWTQFLPNASALEKSSRALHEMLASLWYQLRY
ncbi:YdcF family protein [Aliikangiella sp. IMCC44359]|uniref:YdcF family protein n=1 Tax=Aliikangiella sp. IMCC44359 TaxID=3459125 RepID=UPI00403AEADF